MKVIIVSLALLLCLCSVGNRYDGEVVVLESGEVVELHHNLGDTYFIRRINEAQVQRAADLLRSTPKQHTTGTLQNVNPTIPETKKEIHR